MSPEKTWDPVKTRQSQRAAERRTGCPYCHAAAGERCVTRAGGRPLNMPHAVRIALAKNKR